MQRTLEVQGETEIVKHCEKCGNHGQVWKQNYGSIFMECPSCNHRWKTRSEICHKCYKPNGFPSPGICSSCYSEGYNDW
jgi:hypothetical protein